MTDPNLTAYLFDELDGDERERVERALAEDLDLAGELDALDETAGLLRDAFAAEPKLRPRRGGGAIWVLALAAAVFLAIGVGLSLPEAEPASRAVPEDEAPAPTVLIAEHEDPGAPVQCTGPGEDLAIDLADPNDTDLEAAALEIE